MPTVQPVSPDAHGPDAHGVGLAGDVKTPKVLAHSLDHGSAGTDDGDRGTLTEEPFPLTYTRGQGRVHGATRLSPGIHTRPVGVGGRKEDSTYHSETTSGVMEILSVC